MRNHTISCPLCQSSRSGREYTLKDPRGSVLYRDCPSCGLVRLDPAHYLTRDAEKQRYDLHRNAPGDAGYEAFLERLAAPLAARLAPGSEGLDFGSGPGPALYLLMAKKGFSAVNYDPHYAPDTGLLARRYDFVTCTEAAEHFHEPGKEFLLLDGLLKPGGYLGLMTKILYDDIDFAKWWYLKDPTHVCFYRERTFEWLSEKMGWELHYPARDVIIFRKKK